MLSGQHIVFIVFIFLISREELASSSLVWITALSASWHSYEDQKTNHGINDVTMKHGHVTFFLLKLSHFSNKMKKYRIESEKKAMSVLLKKAWQPVEQLNVSVAQTYIIIFPRNIIPTEGCRVDDFSGPLIKSFYCFNGANRSAWCLGYVEQSR